MSVLIRQYSIKTNGLRLSTKVFCLFLSISAASLSANENSTNSVKTEEIALTKNPFKKPSQMVVEKTTSSVTSQIRQNAEIKLRAILYAGENSIVNVNGKNLRVGEKYIDYRLIRVEEDRAIFDKSGNQVILMLNGEYVQSNE